eukprot:TRINITY_DN6552_c0_g1_i1.p1 TRINITY_DN6552_c0_g1~~TRINITY_DN6552_c0_g1_i1.p1  ORF type:complete len:998 (-),score=214.85 TRINITY_DN6552_c0_g1_i1:1049-4042(-)
MTSDLQHVPGFTIQEKISRGGFVLCKALDNSTNKRVILKYLEESLAAIDVAIHRRKLLEEFKITSQCSGDYVWKATEKVPIGNDQDEALVFEDFGGVPLNQHSQSLRRGLHLSEFLEISISITRSLLELHKRKFIHCNISSFSFWYNSTTKILKLTEFHHAKKLIFGLVAKKFACVPEYTAPEHSRLGNALIDQRADLYSTGIVFYELLLQKTPFANEDDVVQAHLTTEVTPVFKLRPNVPIVISKIISKLLSKSPAGRYQSAFGLLSDLRKCKEKFDISSSPLEFPIAKRDIPSHFHLPNQVVGRGDQIKEINTELGHLISRHRKSCVMITGPAGVGKTSLVKSLKLYEGVRFAYGKFDPAKGKPYSAIFECFTELVKLILGYPRDKVEDFAERIQAALTQSAKVITDAIPEVASILGEVPPLENLAPIESLQRFQSYFCAFARTVATREDPVVIFLDDMQHCDASSLELLLAILNDPDAYVLALLAYEETSANIDHRKQLLSSIKSLKISTTYITLGPISTDSVAAIISSATQHMDPNVAQPLAEVVQRKTRGNPFFVSQFLKMLYAEVLPSFNADSGTWSCNIEKIKKLSCPENVLQFVIDSLKNMPEDFMKFLSECATIGTKFNVVLLEKLTSDSENVERNLLRAINEGFLKIVGPNTYDFVHDSIPKVAEEMLDSDWRWKRHVEVGLYLLDNFKNEDGMIFEIANHFVTGQKHTLQLTDPCEKQKVFELLFAAAQKAKSVAAYIVAVSYVSLGLKMSGEELWENQYDLAFAMNLLYAEVLCLKISTVDKVDRVYENLMTRAVDLEHKIQVYESKMVQYSSMPSSYEHMVKICIEALTVVGVQLPQNPKEEVRKIDEEIQKRLSEVPLAKLLADLPQMTDSHHLAVLRIIGIVSMASIFVDPNIFNLLVALGTEITFDHGTTPMSVSVLACYGGRLCRENNLQQGFEFAYEAMMLGENVYSRYPYNCSKAYYWVGVLGAITRRSIRECLELFD